MKGFVRQDLNFSLCGLNCALCAMRIDGYCPGCGGGPGNQSCKIARCAIAHGSPAYCFSCSEFPCDQLGLDSPYDAVITRRNQRADLERAAEMGPDVYGEQLREKDEILRVLLERFNDGRRKTLYCVAVNLLPLSELRDILQALEATQAEDLKTRASRAAALLQEAGKRLNVELKLRRKPKDKGEIV